MRLITVKGLFACLLTVSMQAQELKPPVPYPPIREADVIWSKRIWRVIELKEKTNFPYYFSSVNRPALFRVIQQGVFSGKLKAFENDDFQKAYSTEDFTKLIVKSDSITIYNASAAGEQLEFGAAVHDTLSSDQVVQYWVKEDWFFDRQRSVMDVRIIGICPVRYDEDKELYVPMFWVYYPECREWLNSFTAVNPMNDAEERGFDELFTKRKFTSYIRKESNLYDRNIEDYATGTDALLESDRIKNQMLRFEHDMWQY